MAGPAPWNQRLSSAAGFGQSPDRAASAWTTQSTYELLARRVAGQVFCRDLAPFGSDAGQNAIVQGVTPEMKGPPLETESLGDLCGESLRGDRAAAEVHTERCT